jgi:hypothetical protein
VFWLNFSDDRFHVPPPETEVLTQVLNCVFAMLALDASLTTIFCVVLRRVPVNGAMTIESAKLILSSTVTLLNVE